MLHVHCDRADRRILNGLSAANSVTSETTEEGQEAVVIFMGNRIDFMVVATGTIYAQSEKCLRGRENDVVQIVVQCLLLRDRFIIPNSESIVSGRDYGIGRAFLEFVTSQLFLDEFGVRFILIETTYYIIAILPGKGFRAIPLVAVGLCETNDVQPMTAPAFAVLR